MTELLDGTQQLFLWFLRSSLQASVLVALVLVLQFVLRRRVSPGLLLLFWLLVLVKLLVPVTPVSELSLFNLGPYLAVEQFNAVVFAPAAAGDWWAPLVRWLPMAWLAGLSVFITLRLLEWRRFRRAVRTLAVPAPAAAIAVLETCRAEAGVRRDVSLRVLPGLAAPLTYGWRRPVILLPAGVETSLSAGELRFVTLHELSHVRRCDPLVNWLLVAVAALHWFNPVVRFALRQFKLSQELRVDADVLARVGEAERLSYGRTLIRFVESYSRQAPVSGAAGLLGANSQMTRRIKMITTFRIHPRLAGGLGIALFLVLGFFTVTSAAQQDRTGWTPLHFAADKGDQAEALALLDRGAAIDAVTAKGDSALRLAVLRNHVDTARLLLGRGAAFSLHDAAGIGDLPRVKALLDKGAPLDAPDADGTTALRFAALRGHAAVARLLLDKGAVYTIHDAAALGDLARVAALIASGAAFDAPDRDGETPLIWAAYHRQVAVVKLLLEKGARVDFKDRSGLTPLMMASSRGSAESVRLLLEKGADVNARNKDGFAPLLGATTHDDTNTVALMLGKGADVNVKYADGSTPLHQAARKGLAGVAALLLERGAKIDPRNDDGQTPLFVAVLHGKADVARLLLAKGAKVDARNKAGEPLVRAAAAFDNPGMVALLLDKGAAVDARDTEKGWTALHAAASAGHVAVAALLLDRGADVNARAADGQTPLHRAIIDSRAQVVKLLVERGADMNTQDKNGLTPLLHSIRSGQAATSKLLSDKGARDAELPPAGDFLVNQLKRHRVFLLADRGSDVAPVRFLASSLKRLHREAGLRLVFLEWSALPASPEAWALDLVETRDPAPRVGWPWHGGPTHEWAELLRAVQACNEGLPAGERVRLVAMDERFARRPAARKPADSLVYMNLRAADAAAAVRDELAAAGPAARALVFCQGGHLRKALDPKAKHWYARFRTLAQNLAGTGIDVYSALTATRIQRQVPTHGLVTLGPQEPFIARYILLGRPYGMEFAGPATSLPGLTNFRGWAPYYDAVLGLGPAELGLPGAWTRHAGVARSLARLLASFPKGYPAGRIADMKYNDIPLAYYLLRRMLGDRFPYRYWDGDLPVAEVGARTLKLLERETVSADGPAERARVKSWLSWLWFVGQGDEFTSTALIAMDEAEKLQPGDALTKAYRVKVLAGMGYLGPAEKALAELLADPGAAWCPLLPDAYLAVADLLSKRKDIARSAALRKTMLALVPAWDVKARQ